MTTKCYAQVRGSVIRVTRLDAFGTPLLDPLDAVVTKGISSVTLNEVTDTEPELKVTDTYGDLMLRTRPVSELLHFTADVRLCGVDPGLIQVMTGQQYVTDRIDDNVGFGVDTKIDLRSFGFALEVWSRITGATCEDARWGYTVFPFLKGGRLGGFEFANSAVTFEIKGARTYRHPGWGLGPYQVTRDAEGNLTQLLEPMGSSRQWQNMLTTVAPPEPGCGIIVPFDDSINGGNPFYTTPDVLDNQVPEDPGAGTVDGGSA